MMDRPLVRIGAYAGFGLVTFVIALLVTFPDGAVREIASVQIEHRLEQRMDRNLEVEVGDLDLWWLGLELQNLSISEPTPSANPAGPQKAADDQENPNAKAKKSQNGEEASGGQPRLQITVPSLGARLAPLSSLFNLGISAKYHLGLGGGSISGTYTRSSGSQSVYVAINDLDLNQSPLLVQFTGVPMFGTLSGEGTFEFATDRPVVTGGQFEMTGEKVTIGPKQELKLEAIPFGHVNIPQTNFGNMQLALNIEREGENQPRLVLEEWRSKGRDLQLQIWGHADLARRMARSEARLKLRLRLNPEFVNENEAMGAMLNNEKMQNGKRGDWHGLVFWGPLGDMQWKGSPTAAAGPDEEGGGEGGQKGKQGGGKGKKKKKGAPKKK